MKKLLLNSVALSLAMFTSTLHAATGEWWEITVKMEMEGMPFAMPAQTSKVCMPKGGQGDPSVTQGKDKNCKMTDVKHSGNTAKFKGTCVDNGETMNITGETSHDSNSFKSNVKMTGKSQGENVDMKMASSGKRIGGACDTEELDKKAKELDKKIKAQIDAGMAAACDTSKHKTINWISSSSMFIGPKPSCPGKQEAFCNALRQDVPRDVLAFQMLEQHEKAGKNEKVGKGEKFTSVAKTCNLNMDSIKKSLCKAKAKSGPLSFLEASCPVEAKAYRELQRKQEECEGRGFTSGDPKMKQCMGGQMLEAEAAEEARPAKSRKAKADAETSDSSSSGSNSDTVLEGAKALKGLFGF